MELYDQAQNTQEVEAVKLFKLFCVGSLVGNGPGGICQIGKIRTGLAGRSDIVSAESSRKGKRQAESFIGIAGIAHEPLEQPLVQFPDLLQVEAS